MLGALAVGAAVIDELGERHPREFDLLVGELVEFRDRDLAGGRYRRPEHVEQAEGELSLFSSVDEADVLKGLQSWAKAPGAYVENAHLRTRVLERVDDL